MNTDRDTTLQAAANGNAAALEFLRAFARRAHYVDDIADRDKLPEEGASFSPAALAQREQEWLLVLSGNPFFLANRAALVPAMVLALNAWVDSEVVAWDSNDVRDVVKGQWHEVVWLVAWLTGGWAHLRAASMEFREYDLESRDEAAREQEPERMNGAVR